MTRRVQHLDIFILLIGVTAYKYKPPVVHYNGIQQSRLDDFCGRSVQHAVSKDGVATFVRKGGLFLLSCSVAPIHVCSCSFSTQSPSPPQTHKLSTTRDQTLFTRRSDLETLLLLKKHRGGGQLACFGTRSQFWEMISMEVQVTGTVSCRRVAGKHGHHSRKISPSIEEFRRDTVSAGSVEPLRDN